MSPQPIRIEERVSASASAATPAAPSEAELEQLRQLVLGYDDRRLDDLQGWLNDPGHRAAEVSKILPRAVRLRAGDDPELGEALAPAIEAAFADLVRRDPDAAARMIAPVIWPAIRGAIGRDLTARLRTLRLSLTQPGVRWWLEARREGVAFSQIADRHTLVHRIEHLVLFHRASGQPLLEVSNRDARPIERAALMEEIARMRDMMSSDDAATVPRRPRPAVCSVAIEQSPRLVLAAVVRGAAPELLQGRMLGVLDAIETDRRLALRAFNGDAGAFEGCRSLLEGCLVTEYADPSARAAIRGGMVAVGAAVAAFAGWWFLG